MKTLSLALLGFALIVTGVANIIQTFQIKELQTQVICLQKGMIYVGDDFCAEDPKELSN